MTTELRDYQHAMIAGIRDHWRKGARRVLAVAPTGSGKTHLMARATAQALDRGRKVGIVVHRRELLNQAVRAVTGHGVPADHPRLTITTIQSAHRTTLDDLDLLIVDEAHLALARTWRAFIDRQRRAYVLGLTATPYRLDGRGLGEMFCAIVVGPQVLNLVARGVLVPARTFAPSVPDLDGVATVAGDWDREGLAKAMMRPRIVGSIIDHYQRLAGGRQAIVFGTTIAHSKMLCEAFNAAGITATHIDGSTPHRERDAVIEAFRGGQGQVLTSCNVLSEGLDLPAVSAIILARPTQSEVIYRQQIGRGSRACAGKADFVILDHAGNALRHGLYATPKTHTLEGRRKPAKERQAPTESVRQCMTCYGVYESRAGACPYCGAVPPVKKRQTREIAGELVELNDDGKLETGWYRRVMRSIWTSPREQWERRLAQMAIDQGYKAGWVHHQIEMRTFGPKGVVRR